MALFCILALPETSSPSIEGLFVGTIFVLINAEVGMKRLMATVGIGLVGMFGFGVVSAKEETGAELIVDYKRNQSLEGASEDQMMMRAWLCYTDTLSIMQGAEFKEKGVSLEKAKSDLAMDEDYQRLFSKGYEYKNPTDITIGVLHAQCLIDAHKKITSK